MVRADHQMVKAELDHFFTVVLRDRVRHQRREGDKQGVEPVLEFDPVGNG